uniref:Uncharacterized protein n=1 Tax=Romanomermis culicivorax TaxID=13658 RepID=A0A915HSH6_ROMCU
MCMNRSSLAQSNDFCRNTRHQENRTEGKSAQYEMTKEIMLQGEIFQKITIYREMIQRHMREVESFSDKLMHDKKAKNIVGAMIDGNYKEVAINLGFLTGSVGPGYAANYTALKGANLAGEGSKFLGSCLRLASPFLARVSSTFVAYDLYKQIQTHNNGNRDALVGVVSDSVVLTIDVGSVVVGTLQVLDLLGSSLSAFLSPIGSAIGAVIFISADVNQAVKTVDRINSLIKLTAYEKFEEGLLASVHANPDKYILDLIEATQPNDEVTKSSMAVVKNMSQFQIYGSPSLERCKPQQSLNICTSGVKEVEDNFANFTQWSKFYSMTWSDTSNNVRIVCANERSIGNSGNFRLGHDGELWLSKGKFFIGKHRMALECNNFEVIFDKNVSNASKAFLKAASGNDSIVGFLERSNVISFSGGNKYFIGGNKPDTFILHDEEIATGFIDGSDGIDTLDFSQYAKSKLSIKFYNGVKTAHFLVMPGSNKRLDIDRVERFIGRADAQDIMITNCNTTFLDLLGGTEQLPDSINIIASNNRLCRYNLAVELYHSTNVWNQACSGTFVYALNKYSKPGIVKLQNSCTSNQSAEIILETNLPLRGVLKMQRIVDDDGHIRVEIQFENGIKLFIIDFNFERTHFLFEDFHVKVKMTEILNLRNVSLIEDPSCMIKESIIKTNLPLRAVSKMQRIVDDDDDQTQLEIQFENGIVLLVVDFNLDRTHFLFEDFNIRIENTGIVGFMKVPVIENPYDTMQDLLELHHLNAVLIVEDEVNQTKIITAHSRLIANAKNPQHDMLNANVLSNDLKFVDSVLIESNNVTLKPIPLSFTEEIKLIILQPTDIIEFTSIKISKLA